MPLVGGNFAALDSVSIGTTATLIASEDANRRALVFRNNDASASLYVGGSDVTTSGPTKGLEVKAGEPYSDTKSRCAVYGIVASGTVAISGRKVV